MYEVRIVSFLFGAARAGGLKKSERNKYANIPTD